MNLRTYLQPFGVMNSPVSTAMIEKIILNTLSQITEAPDEDIEYATAVIDNIFDVQWENYDTLSPRSITSISKFIDSFWDESSLKKVNFCISLISHNYLDSHLHLLIGVSNSINPVLKNVAIRNINSLTSYYVRARSIVCRFNTILQTEEEFGIFSSVEDVRQLKNSITLDAELFVASSFRRKLISLRLKLTEDS